MNATSNSSFFPANLSLPLNIGINIQELGTQFQSDVNDFHTFVVPNTAELGGVMTYTFQDIDQTKKIGIEYLQSLTVQLVTRNGASVSNNGSEWFLILQFV